VSALAGVGVDLVDVARVRSLLARHSAAEKRLFTDAERRYCRGFGDPVPRFAARVAAKEAVGKALGTGILVWREVEVASGGRPAVRLHGRTAAAARARGVLKVDLSLSHTDTQAIAVAVASGSGVDVEEAEG
jgi:holo-[acyl-carrier protein] synthase